MFNFTLTDHAYSKINGDVALAHSVFAAANTPSVTYSNGRVPGQMRHIRGNICAVVDPRSHKIITFYQNVEETDLRPDQTDADAQAYAAKRAQDRAIRDRKRQERRNRDRALTASMKAGKGK